MKAKCLVGLTAVLVAGCGGGGRAGAAWGATAEEHRAAWYEAGLEGIPNQLAFLDEEMVWEDRTGGREIRGRDDFVLYAGGFLGSTDPSHPGALFLSAEGSLDQYWWTRPLPADYMDRVEMDGALVRAAVNSASVASGRIYGPGIRDFDAIEELADRYVSLWNEGGDASDVYVDDAHIEDTLLGLSVDGSDPIGEGLGTGQWPDLAALRITDLPDDTDDRGLPHLPQGRGRAIYIAPSQVNPSLPDEIRIIVDVDDGSGCPGLIAVNLEWDGHRVLAERRYHEVESARRCLDLEALLPGWWEGIEIPDPVRVEETEPMVWPQRDVEVRIFNGNPEMTRLVRWGLERFDEGGLGLPPIGSVTFLTHESRCRGFAGFYGQDESTADITLCRTPAEVCEEGSCSTWTRSGRLALLHEFSHAWMHEYLDEGAKTEFLQFENLPRWSDHADDWHQRGVERAADTIAFGLMDELDSGHFGPTHSCQHYQAGFLLLTGREPVSECP